MIYSEFQTTILYTTILEKAFQNKYEELFSVIGTHWTGEGGGGECGECEGNGR